MSGSVEVWIWLLLVMKPYNFRTVEILGQFDFIPEKAAAAIRSGRVLLSADEKKRASKITASDVREVVELCRNSGVRIITFDSDEYPVLLKRIYNPPIVLFCVGNLEGIDKQLTVSAVGTRKASDYGLAVTQKIISQLARDGVVITSGLALGIDTAVHKACLDGGGRTIGVLACGIFVDYPRGHSGLKRQIAKSGGAVISELLPFETPTAEYFQHRNRIISGLSLGTLIIEADEKSGALITANLACEQGREVFFIPPHDILSPHFMGVADLGRDGAVPVYSHIDILAALLNYTDFAEYLEHNC